MYHWIGSTCGLSVGGELDVMAGRGGPMIMRRVGSKKKSAMPQGNKLGISRPGVSIAPPDQCAQTVRRELETEFRNGDVGRCSSGVCADVWERNKEGPLGQ